MGVGARILLNPRYYSDLDAALASGLDRTIKHECLHAVMNHHEEQVGDWYLDSSFQGDFVETQFTQAASVLLNEYRVESALLELGDPNVFVNLGQVCSSLSRMLRFMVERLGQVARPWPEVWSDIAVIGSHTLLQAAYCARDIRAGQTAGHGHVACSFWSAGFGEDAWTAFAAALGSVPSASRRLQDVDAREHLLAVARAVAGWFERRGFEFRSVGGDTHIAVESEWWDNVARELSAPWLVEECVAYT